jgi:hypothetical protein
MKTFRRKENVVKALFILSVGLLFMAASTMAHASPVGLWKLNEGSGSTVNDSIGDNDGQINGATWTEGELGGGLSFDGIDDSVDIDPTDFKLQSFTASVRFVYGTGQEKWTRILDMSNYYVGREGWLLSYMDNTGDIEFRLQDVVTAGAISISGSNFTPGEWHTLTATFDGTSKIGTLYLDGVSMDSETGSGDLEYAPVGHFSFGANLNGNKEHYDGSLDDVAIWDRALADWEVEQVNNFSIEIFDALLNDYGYGDAEMDLLYAHIGAGSGEGLQIGGETWYYFSEPLPEGRQVGDVWTEGGYTYFGTGSYLSTDPAGGTSPSAPELPMGAMQMMVLGLGGVLARFRKRG